MKTIKKIIVKLNLLNFISVFMYIFRIFPINNKKVVFVNFSGKGYGDNLKYIHEKMVKKNKDFKYVWLVNSDNNLKENYPNNIKLVKIFTIKSLYELATAKIWINNSRFDIFVKKRKNQLYIQTWHGGLALKKIEFDAEEKLSEYYKKVMINDNKMINVMLSNSDFCSNMYRNGFKYNGKILLSGSPRNDVLINNEKINCKKIKEKFNLKDKQIILYAPTFRNDYEKNPYDIDFNLLVERLNVITNKEWTVLIKLHPRLQGSSISNQFNKKWLNVTEYQDIQELICASDLLVTDYSSTMFEAMIINKPVILYANDIEDYVEERGLYFQFDELPFTLCTNNGDIRRLINNDFFDTSNEKYNEFKKKIGLYEKGNACDITINYIDKVLNGEKDE